MLGIFVPTFRANIINLGRDRGDDMVEVLVRASSKTGAIATARLEATKAVPFRDQRVSAVRQLDSNRVFNKWEVDIVDEDSMEVVG